MDPSLHRILPKERGLMPCDGGWQDWFERYLRLGCSLMGLRQASHNGLDVSANVFGNLSESLFLGDTPSAERLQAEICVLRERLSIRDRHGLPVAWRCKNRNEADAVGLATLQCRLQFDPRAV